MDAYIQIGLALADEKRFAAMHALAHSDLTAQEIANVMQLQASAASYQLRVLTDAGLVTVQRSDVDNREAYYHLQTHVLHAYLAHVNAMISPAIKLPQRPYQVLFVCRANSARSQMAEAFVRQLDNPHIRVASAGITASTIHPLTIAAMHEVGITLDTQYAKTLDAVTDTPDVVISVCDYARKTIAQRWPDAQYIHWSLRDPAKPGLLTDFQAVRDELAQRVRRAFQPTA